MQVLKEDRELHYENNFRLFKKKVRKPVGASNPDVIMSGGKPMVKSSILPKKKRKKGLFKRIALGIVTGGASNIIRDRKKIGKGIAKGAKAVGKAVKKISQVSLLAPLIPLFPVMRKALKSKGLTPPKDPVKLAEMFYKVIVLKRSTFDPDPFPHYENHVAPIVAIIPPIINFVKNLIKNKKKGAKLPPEENAIAVEAENVINEVVKEEAKSGASSEQSAQREEGEEIAGIRENGKLNFKSPWVIGAAAAVILAIILIARK